DIRGKTLNSYMAENKMMRLSQVAKILKVATTTIVDHLSAEGFTVESSPNTKIAGEQIRVLAEEFDSDELRAILKPAEESIEKEGTPPPCASSDEDVVRYFGDEPKSDPARTETVTPAREKEAPTLEPRLPGVKVVGKVELD